MEGSESVLLLSNLYHWDIQWRRKHQAAVRYSCDASFWSKSKFLRCPLWETLPCFDADFTTSGRLWLSRAGDMSSHCRPWCWQFAHLCRSDEQQARHRKKSTEFKCIFRVTVLGITFVGQKFTAVSNCLICLVQNSLWVFVIFYIAMVLNLDFLHEMQLKLGWVLTN